MFPVVISKIHLPICHHFLEESLCIGIASSCLPVYARLMFFCILDKACYKQGVNVQEIPSDDFML